MSMSFQTKPYMLNRGEAQKFDMPGAQVIIEATSEQTGGTFNLFDVTCRPGYATSLHVHYAEDVAVYVLEGALTFFWGNEKREAVAGSYFYQPRGIPHGFCVNGETSARFLYMAFPAGLDRMAHEQEFSTLNSESMVIAARYKIEILGPLPE